MVEYRVAVIGTGGIARAHGNAWKEAGAGRGKIVALRRTMETAGTGGGKDDAITGVEAVAGIPDAIGLKTFKAMLGERE
jgi:predicted dehydrogenase